MELKVPQNEGPAFFIIESSVEKVPDDEQYG